MNHGPSSAKVSKPKQSGKAHFSAIAAGTSFVLVLVIAIPLLTCWNEHGTACERFLNSILRGWVFLLLLAIDMIAIIGGELALSDIQKSNGMLRGRRLALLGLILGYIDIFTTLFGFFALMVFVLGII